ncbi:hypothetical protein ACPWSR_03835 [Alloiococcus sp. CFN-8]|uniref:hypothetical protein n=1 Tax=Alloiococcus sp. CFN-8 TaxID=3416081 RepID=UPI003CFA7F16
MIFLNKSIFEEDGFKNGTGILIIKNSTYVDLIMLDEEEFDESEDDLDLTDFLKKNGYNLDELWSEGYSIYYGHVTGIIFQIELNLSLPS